MDFCVFDTEDNSVELLEADANSPAWQRRVVQIAAISWDGERFYFGDDVEKFLTWVQESPYTKFYAHNIAYDLGALFREKLDELDIYFVGGRMIKAHWSNKVFLDTYNMFPMTAKKIGEKFGIDKLDFDPYSKEYIFADCEIILRAMQLAYEFTGEYNLERMPNTLGGVAVKIYGAGGGEHPQDITTFEQETAPFMFGGRVELFKRRHFNKKNPILYCDINSLYPFVMMKKYPGECSETKSLDGYGVAAVEITVPEMFIPPLPVRREDGSIFYPYGKLAGVWPICEIQNAISIGCKVTKLHYSYSSKNGHAYYKDFVRDLYGKRLKAKSEAEKLMIKLCMNNLYGQLATSGKMTRLCEATEKRVEQGGQMVGSKIFYTYGMPLPAHTNYFHGAYVTAYGRMELLNALRQIKPEHLIYCDTDSVIFDSRDGNPFKIGKALGEMKIEGQADIVQTWSPKVYRFGNDYKAKGVRKDKARDFCERGEATVAAPFRLREAIVFFDRDAEKGKFRASVWRNVVKRKISKYDKKILRGETFYPRKVDMRDLINSVIPAI